MGRHGDKYSVSECENLIPFERDIYVQLIKNDIEESKNQDSSGKSSTMSPEEIEFYKNMRDKNK